MAKPEIKGTISSPDLPKDFFSLFKKGELLEVSKINEELADLVLKEIKEVIEKQKFKWPPLEPNYLQRKIKKGLDPRTLIATRDYLDNGIGKYKVDKYIFVGPLPGKHKDSKLTYAQLARFLEFGTENMPARQVYRPVKAIVLRVITKLRKQYEKAAKQRAKERAKQAKKKKKGVG